MATTGTTAQHTSATALERLTGIPDPSGEEYDLLGPGLSPTEHVPVAVSRPLELPGDVDHTTALAGLGGEAAFVIALAGYLNRRRWRRRLKDPNL
jgi:hypothetical protein